MHMQLQTLLLISGSILKGLEEKIVKQLYNCYLPCLSSIISSVIFCSLSPSLSLCLFVFASEYNCSISSIWKNVFKVLNLL